MRGTTAVLLLLCGCGGGGGGGSIDAAAHIDARPGDAIDAANPIDATPDAEPIDAAPPDAPVSCDPPAFTAGVSTLAGCAEAGAADGERGVARFANPVNVAIGPDGDVYVADFDNGRVRAVSADGTTRTVVAQADFHRPFGLAFAASGTLYVSTDDNATGGHTTETGTVWSVNTTTGVATVIAHDLGRPRGLAVLGDGRIVLSDYLHHDVRLLDPSTGNVTPLSGLRGTGGFADGDAATARFQAPYGAAVMTDGRIAIADYGNHRIRAVSPTDGTAVTLAGTGAIGIANGDALTTATFSSPQDIVVAGTTLFVADTDNFVVRRIATGEVTTVVGSGTGGWLDDDALLTAQIYGLEGIAVAADGSTLWIADGNRGDDTAPYNRVRVADLTP